MPAIEASTVPIAQSGLVVKMEDRKRPPSYDAGDPTPPLKKQATSMNGGGKAHPDADMPWKDDLERIQKDAIWRQMQEYKREKTSLESRLKELSKTAAYHDEHIRVIDAWFKQLLDEIKATLSNAEEEPKEKPSFPSALSFAGHEDFQKHLQSRSEEIKETVSRLSSRAPSVSSDAAQVQDQLTKALAEEKAAVVKFEQAVADKQQLEERLESASLRYMVAEKKIDRARSLTVARLEKQHILGPHTSSGEESSIKREDSASANGSAEVSDKLAELEVSYNKTLAMSEKQKEQLEKLEAENSKLLSQVTEINAKNSKLSDEDYAHTDLFKQLKSQYEDVVTRINHLEATHTQLREEAEKLQAERTAYKVEIENESQLASSDKEAQLSKVESDLTRIRNARDELLADQQMRKANQEQEKSSVNHMNELLEARESRITALESEVERLKTASSGAEEVRPATAELSAEELRTKFESLDKQYEMLNTELSSMQSAFKRTSKLASQKLAELNAAEERAQRAMAEKAKADQKYFAAMKSKESRDAELRSLRIQNMKSSDIVSQLKDAEATTRNLVSNVEKQLAETKEAHTNTLSQYRASQQQVTEANVTIQGLKLQVADLKTDLANKDTSLATANSTCRKAETEVEGLKSTLSDTKKSVESWKNKGLGNQSSEYEMLRSLALCTVCRRNFKDTAIKTCGHVFCLECVEERQQLRSRKCPNCNKAFGNNDYMHVTL